MPKPVNRTAAGLVDGVIGLLGRGWRAWPDAVWPPCCAVCGEDGGDGRDLCTACAAALPWNLAGCPRCGLPDALASAGGCAACRRHPPVFGSTVAAFRYGFPLDRLLPRFKFHGDLAAGRLAAQLLGDAVAASGRFGVRSEGRCAARSGVRSGDRSAAEARPALVPLPLHPARLRERGFDQALELARPLARRFGLPLRSDLLRRIRATAAQTGLHDVGQRRANLQGAFAVPPVALPAEVVLVDDVMTTGATLGEAASVLRAAGVTRIEAWVVARTAE